MAFWPTMTLEWAPASGPLVESPTWVDITTRLREWEWSYGRNDENGEFEAGSGYVLLDNRDRAFDPSNSAGAWYGNIKPRRQFRLQATWNAVTYPIFRAHAQGYPQSYPSEVNKLVRIDLADVLALLKAVDLATLGFNRPPELSSDRLGAILDEAGIATGMRDLDVGDFYVGATVDYTEGVGSALEEAQAVTTSEDWPLYVTRAGYVASI